MAIAVGDVIRCAVRQSLGGNDIINVYEFQHAGSSPVDEGQVMSAVVNYFETAYGNIESHVSTDVSPVDIKVDVVDVINGVKRVVANVGLDLWGGGYVPAAAGERMPNGIAVMLKLLTDVGKIFGKKFIGGFTETSIGGNGVGATLTTALASMVTDLLTAMVVGGTEDFVGGVLSVNQNHVGEFHEFQAGDVPQNVAYQRRRAPNVGS